MPDGCVIAGVLFVALGIAMAVLPLVSLARRRSDDGRSWGVWSRFFTNPSFPPPGRSPFRSALIVALSVVMGLTWLTVGLILLLSPAH